MLRAAIKRIFHVTSIGSLRARFGAGSQNLHFFSGYCNKEEEIFAKSVLANRGGKGGGGLFNFILIGHSMSGRLD